MWLKRYLFERYGQSQDCKQIYIKYILRIWKTFEKINTRELSVFSKVTSLYFMKVGLFN